MKEKIIRLDILNGEETCVCGNPMGKGEGRCFRCKSNALTNKINKRLLKTPEEAIKGMARDPSVNFIGNR